MKRNLPQFLVALLLLAVARHMDAANVSVTTSALPRTAGTASGGGSVAAGTSLTLTAVATNDCYEFVDWTAGGVKVSTDNPYTFSAKRTEALVANFAQLKYTILIGTEPTNAGIVTGGGKKGCGTPATVKAVAKPGFAFENWTSDGVPVSSSATYEFTVSENASLVANFKDIGPPTVKINFPMNNEQIDTAAFPIQGTATDNVGVVAVYYSLNGSGWIEASNLDDFKPWYAWVTLIPNSANTVAVYGVDTSGNTNKPVVTQFRCTAAGLAPMSVAGYQSGVTDGTNTSYSYVLSFDLASYVRFSARTNDHGEVGTYTYTPTGPDTAELVPNRVFPTGDTNSNPPLELTFTNAFGATYIQGSNSGTLDFMLAGDIVPATLDGSTIVATSFVNTNLVSTNVFGSSTFAFQDNLGEAFSGTYTLTKFTAVGAFIVETVTDPPSEAATNCIVLTITDGGAPSIGYYDYESLDSSTNEPFDLGTFVLNPGTASTTFVGPATLDGLKGTVSPVGEPPFIRTYGNGTFASLSLLSSNEPTDVGINLANTRISSDTGTDQFIGLGPPYIMGLDDETVDATFTLADKANYVVEGDPSRRGTITYTKLTTNVPVAITGHTITAKPKGKGEISVVSFTNNTFRSINSADTGTYTYAPYSPTMALVQANFTGGSETGTTDYVILEFTTTMGGPYVSARADPASAGGWEYESGNFTFTKTK